MLISKIEIAKQQLESAIKAFKADDKLAAITLAGASEEILGKLCKKADKNTAIEAMMPIAFSAIPSITETQLARTLNFPRNNLKHINESDVDPVEILKMDAQLMLLRAMLNWMALGYPSSTLILDFQKWLKDNPLTLE